MSTEIIATRVNKTLTARRDQILLNIAAWKGGRPYIEQRLWRAPNESDLSWSGTSGSSGFNSAGRVQRAALVNDAGRVVSKITQYLFKQPAERTGIDEEWAADVTGSGISVLNFWIDVSERLTAGQWLWLQADRMPQPVDPETGMPRPRTLLEKQLDKDIVRWSVWPCYAVPDWSFAPDGKLRWLITEGVTIDDSDPSVKAEEKRVRTLWTKTATGVEISQYAIDKGKTANISLIQEPTVVPGMDEIPFVLVGTPSVDPWWFDDVESLQAQMLNLDSLQFENLVRTVFPQLVIGETMLASLEMKLVERVGATNGQRMMECVREVIRGLDSPMVESANEKGITRFIQPAHGDQQTLPGDIDRKRKFLFQMVGLSLFNNETRQIQTAESKQFDQLDTESTLKHRANILQDSENRLIALSKAIDPSFAGYNPMWPTSFDVLDAQAATTAISMLSNIPDLTISMRKLVLKLVLRLVKEMGVFDNVLFDAANEEIEALEDYSGEPDDVPDDDE